MLRAPSSAHLNRQAPETPEGLQSLGVRKAGAMGAREAEGDEGTEVGDRALSSGCCGG